MKMPRLAPGLPHSELFVFRSVPRDDRAAELVAQTDHGRLNVAGLGIEAVDGRSGRASELVALGLELRIIVLESDDPVRGDAVFPAGADGPAVVPLRRRSRTDVRSHRIGDRHAVVHASVAALDIKQVVVDRDTGTAGNRRHPVGTPAEPVIKSGAEDGVEHGAAVIEARNGALEAEHEVAGLPVVACMATTENARSALAEAFAWVEIAERGSVSDVDPLLAGPGATDVTADIDTAPIVNGYDRCRRLGIRPRRQIGGRSGHGTHQKGRNCDSDLFHNIS